MTRRTALKAMGMLVAVLAPDKVLASGYGVLPGGLTGSIKPMNNYHFAESNMNSIIIERISGKTLKIPFSEIFDALEKEG